MPWCGPSQYLLNTTLQDQRLASYVNQHAVPIKLNGEEFSDLFNTYGVHVYPSVLIINASGEEIDRVTGSGDAPDIMQDAYREVTENGKSPTQLLSEFASDPANPDIMYQLLVKYAAREKNSDALAFKVKIEQEHPAYYAKVRAPALFKIADSFFSSRHYEDAISYLKFIIDQIPEGDRRRAFYYISYCYQRMSRIDDALNTLDEAIKFFPSEIHFYFDNLTLAFQHNLRIKNGIMLGEKGRLIDLPFYDKAYLCFVLARIYKLDDNSSAALNLINEAIKLDPQDEYIEFRDELGKA